VLAAKVSSVSAVGIEGFSVQIGSKTSREQIASACHAAGANRTKGGEVESLLIPPYAQGCKRLSMARLRILIGANIFLASFLLFLVEPIAAKQLLPIFGGSASVWMTCLVFFQTALVVAYLYSHWQAQRARWVLHFSLLLIAAVSAVAWSLRAESPANPRLIPFHRSSSPWRSPSACPSSCLARPARSCRSGLRVLSFVASPTAFCTFKPRLSSRARVLSNTD